MYSAAFRGDGPTDELKSAFKRMKAAGCTVLVTGELSEPAQRQITRRVMGDPRMDRARVLALLGQAPDADEWFPGDVTSADPDAHVIEIEDEDRSAAAASAPDELPPLPERSDLAGDLANRIDTILEGRNLLPPQLRVVVAPAYYDPSAEETIVQLVSVLNRIDGMTFLYLPRASVDELDPAVTGRVDGIIDIRTKHADEPEHRWIVMEDGLDEKIETEWFPVEK